ncbi:MAG: methionine gamma-lyase family protein [Clostridia bacterium]|nr:methionine gamma-lyase family protein [Clostridia bacterium]
MVYVQRSRGYDEREAVSVDDIGRLKKFVCDLGFGGIFFVDNCYGEFVEKDEPTDVGADLCCGSLIKNVGGGIAPTGGYVVGKKELCDKVEARLTSPSIAAEVGSYAFGYQYFYQGLFMAPHVVKEALKGSLLIGAALSELGYKTIPKAYKTPYDITRSVTMGSERKLVDFIQSVQHSSPIDSYVSVEPSEMPGYEHKVVMAAGCFVQGSSIELSADAPIKEPFNVFIQGGLNYEHVKICLKEILSKL